MGLIGKVVTSPLSLVGSATRGFVKHTFGRGFKGIKAGLKGGGLSDPRVMKGLGFTSLGLLGTTTMLKISNKQRDRLRSRTSHNRQYPMI